MANKATARARVLLRLDPLPRPCWPRGTSGVKWPKDGTAATAPCCAHLEGTEAIYRLRALPPVAKMEPLAPRTNANLAKLRHNT